MAAGLGSAIRADRAPIATPGPLLSLIAAVVSSFDCVLVGMVAAGLGIEAICDYLGLTRGLLDHSLVRLNLPTPHDRPRRKAGSRKGAWTVEQVRAAIQWRLQGVHPDNIGQRVGRRSGNAVRAKLRRLGVPNPPRDKVRRCDPSQMPAVTEFWFPSPAGDSHGVRTSASASAAMPATAPKPKQEAAPVTPFPAVAAKVAPRPQANRSARRKAPGQRELSVLQDVNAGRNVSTPTTAVASSSDRSNEVVTATTQPSASLLPAPAIRSSVSPNRPVPPPSQQRSLSLPSTPESEVRQVTGADEDVSWVSGIQDIIHNRKAVSVIADLHFGLLYWRSAADRLGMTSSRLRTIRTRIDIPLDHNRKKFTNVYDPDLARQNWVACGCTLVHEPQIPDGRRGHWFFRSNAKNCRGDKFSLWTKRHVTHEIDHDEYALYRVKAEFETERRSQQPVPSAPTVMKGTSYEKLRIIGHPPAQRPGLPGRFGEPMPFAYDGHGRRDGGVASP